MIKQFRKWSIAVRIVICILVSQVCYAHRIVISDIDDTLKDSRTRSFWTMIWRGSVTDSKFLISGMNHTLNYLIDESIVEKVFYVSRVPKIFEDYHAKFLEINSFPSGDFFSRGLQGEAYKYRVIISIIEEEKPSEIIFIGDNAEADPKVYNEVANLIRDKNISSTTYIRRAYKKSIYTYPNQIEFSDGFDLLDKLP